MNEPRNPSGYLRQHRHLQPSDSPLRRYEAAKSLWMAFHPEATPAEYQQTMKRIADECGV